MTFTEAAEAVLRKVGRALHYKKITEIAIEENLLSHVGKTPEVTMSTRLATLTKKDHGDTAIVRVRPGVFALREWGANVVVDPDDGAESSSDASEVADANAKLPEEASPRTTASAPAQPRPNDRNGNASLGETRPHEPRRRDGNRNEPRRRDGNRNELRRGEGNRNEPRRGEGNRNEPRRGEGNRNDVRFNERREAPVAEALAPASEPPSPTEAVAASTATPSQESLPREAPRTPETAPGTGDSLETSPSTEDSPPLEGAAPLANEAPSPTGPVPFDVNAPPPVDMEAAEELAPAHETVAPAPAPARVLVLEDDEDTPPRDAAEIEREERLAASAGMYPEEDDDEEPLLGGPSSERDRGPGGRRRRRRRRGRDGTSDHAATPVTERLAGEGTELRPPEPRDREPRRDEDDAREMETGRDAADLLVSLLTRRDDRQPVPMRSLVDEALRSGRLTGDAAFHVPALTAAARMDTVRRAMRGERARLRVAGGRVGLVDWTLPSDLVRAEADALAALERLRDTARRYVVRRLNELPQASFTEVLVMLLERLGISSLKAARRPGLPQGETHLSGVSRRGPEELPVAVVLRRSGEIGRERVIELRGSLHHYNNAAVGWIVTTGSVLSGAREEATQPGTAPITLIDANMLGRLMDEHGILVSHASVAIPWLDVDLYDALRGG